MCIFIFVFEIEGKNMLATSQSRMFEIYESIVGNFAAAALKTKVLRGALVRLGGWEENIKLPLFLSLFMK